MEPRDFLDYAKSIHGQPREPSELGCRTSINRSYYSLYHESIRLVQGMPWQLRDIPEEKRKESELQHWEVISRLKNWPRSGDLSNAHNDALVLSNSLRSAFLLRKQADYDLDLIITFSQARSQLQRVRNAMRFVVRIRRVIEDE